MDKEDVVYIYTIEYYSVIKKNEILSFAMTWMELEGIILREISQSGKDKYHLISLICGILETKQMNIGEGREKTEWEVVREGGKPGGTLNHRKQTEGCWRGGEWGDGVIG